MDQDGIPSIIVALIGAAIVVTVVGGLLTLVAALLIWTL
jgi:ABC-type phosphate transport system permease subunit